MVSSRSKSSMKIKHRKGEIVTLNTYFKIKGSKTSRLGKCRAKLHSNRSATCIKDGRPLRKVNKRWVYFAK